VSLDSHLARLTAAPLAHSQPPPRPARFQARWEPKKAAAPEDVGRVVQDELDKLAGLEPVSPEFNVTRNYLDWCAAGDGWRMAGGGPAASSRARRACGPRPVHGPSPRSRAPSRLLQPRPPRLTGLPWGVVSPEVFDIEHAKQVGR
jgi:hypothetical protein